MKCTGFRPKPYAEALAKKQASDARKRDLAQNRPVRSGKTRQPIALSKPLSASGAPKALQRNALKAKPDPELAAWGRAVRKRDGNKCQWKAFGPCATGDTRVDPHHIAPRGRRPDLIYVIENGVCLCRTHHDWCHDNPRQAEQMGMLNFDSYELAQKIKAGYVVPGDEDDKRITL